MTFVVELEVTIVLMMCKYVGTITLVNCTIYVYIWVCDVHDVILVQTSSQWMRTVTFVNGSLCCLFYLFQLNPVSLSLCVNLDGWNNLILTNNLLSLPSFSSISSRGINGLEVNPSSLHFEVYNKSRNGSPK